MAQYSSKGDWLHFLERLVLSFRQKNLRDLYFLIFSVGIGVLAAIGALVFRSLIIFFQSLFWAPGSTFVERLIHSPWWLKILVPVGGGLIAGPIITFFVPEAKGPGVPEVIAAVANRQSRMRHRVTLLKALVTSLLIGSGASVGREGPIVQIGASIGSSLAQLFRLSPDLRRVCLASGAAAGIAATFDAPIAGTLFALEIILRDIEIPYISHIIISSIIAAVLSRMFWGEFITFKVKTFELTHYWELWIYLAMGLIAGLIAILFVRMIYGTDRLFTRLPIPDWIKPAIGGLMLGLLALKLPYVLGVGYQTINLALAGSFTLKLAIIILFAKIAATALSIGSGMSGGIFAPSLVLGSTLGTILSMVLMYVVPDVGIRSTELALAGMGAVVAGTTLAPMTAILIIFELTYSYQVLLPLMLCCISSTMVVKLLFGYSAYEMKLIKKGVSIVRGCEVNVLRSLSPRDVIIRNYSTLQDSVSFSEIVERAVRSPHPHFVVLNKNSEWVGVLTLEDVRPYLDKLDEMKELLIAADLMTRDVITISIDDDLEKAFSLFEKHQISFLPVIDPANSKKVLGIVKRDDVLKAYQEGLQRGQVLSASPN